MAKKKSTIREVGIFSPEPEKPTKPRPRAQPKLDETTGVLVRKGMYLGIEDVEYLKQQSRAVEDAGGARSPSSAIVRCLLRAARESGLDLTGCSTEAEIVLAMRKHWK